ncbi:methyl-accepting chemotaxis protein [Sagittula sp. SSi028]|uniref:methyl-accepting chemotaxis protein n=1 Tax=Sagittula sp. SSi028 TaxID=3400636 RepID=UPI003AF52C28
MFRPTIGRAVFSIVILGAIFMAALVFIYRYTETQRSMLEDERRHAEQMSHLLDKVDIQYLQARRAEKDFLLRRDEKYVQRHSETMGKLSAALDAAESQLTTLDMPDALANLGELRTLTDNYAQAFSDVTASVRSVGLSEEDGLQGELRQSVHEIEEILNTIGQPEMQVKMLMMRRHEKDFIMRGDQKYIDRLNARVEEFNGFPPFWYDTPEQRQEVSRLMNAYQTAFVAFAAESQNTSALTGLLSDRYAATEPVLAAMRDETTAELTRVGEALIQNNEELDQLTLSMVAVSVLLFLASGIIVARSVSRPLKKIDKQLTAIAAGDYTLQAPRTRIREVSAIAQAVDNFQTTIEEIESVSKEVTDVVRACAKGDFSRRLETEAHSATMAALCSGVNEIGSVTNRGLQETKRALSALSEGDLTTAMRGEFQGVFAEMKDALNKTAESLRFIVHQIQESGHNIDLTTTEVSSAANDLSRRTESNAASLEQTNAALQQIADSVRTTANSADSLRISTDDMQAKAQQSYQVIDAADQAMQQIKDASSAINSVISLIDDIAFQTNLLALNAGVEAMRAGQAGKGFAVVATEVRALAERSSDAAKEISSLIRSSNTQVDEGVLSVVRTADTMKSISLSIEENSTKIREIAAATQEQNGGISELNAAVGELDRTTQQNAAMFEEMTAALGSLNGETSALTQVIGRFKLENTEEDSFDQTYDVQEDPRLAS